MAEPDQGAGEAPAGPLTGEDFRAVFEVSPDGILLADSGGIIREVNGQLCAMFGYEREELVGSPVERLVPVELREAHRRQREAYARHPHARPMGVDLELRGRRRDGYEIPVEISLSPLRRGEETLVIATVRDVRDRKRLRDFGAGSLKATEEERRRIARELHDDTAQRLSGLLIRLRLAGDAPSEERRRELLGELREEVVDVAEGIRRIARGLRPPALEDAGVVAALLAHARRLREASDVEIEIEGAPVDAHLDPDGKLVLYRVVQEAVSNALRHGDPSRVRVELETVERDGTWVRVTVDDDGSGFDPASETAAEGLGLLGMRERAATVGGRVSVDSERGRGTAVSLEIPSREGEPRG